MTNTQAPLPLCPRVVGATADGKRLRACGAPTPCTEHDTSPSLKKAAGDVLDACLAYDRETQTVGGNVDGAAEQLLDAARSYGAAFRRTHETTDAGAR